MGLTGGARRGTVRVDGWSFSWLRPEGGVGFASTAAMDSADHASHRDDLGRCVAGLPRADDPERPGAQAGGRATDHGVRGRPAVHQCLHRGRPGRADLHGRGRGRQAARQPVPGPVRPGRRAGPSRLVRRGRLQPARLRRACGPPRTGPKRSVPGGWPRPGVRPRSSPRPTRSRSHERRAWPR